MVEGEARRESLARGDQGRLLAAARDSIEGLYALLGDGIAYLPADRLLSLLGRLELPPVPSLTELDALERELLGGRDG